ncbi:MAG TPA: imidazolonepropionase [Euzebyales bacterium]|nr:imidazolonepropionase [Euzebyales bacterium]
MSVVLTGIGRLVSHDPGLPSGGPLALVCDGGRVAWVGQGAPPQQAGDRHVDVGGRCVIPGFVDSHTHLVFAGDRIAEFTARLAGEPYETGGIATTVTATRAADVTALEDTVHRLSAEALDGGTTTLEIKSGYGLTVDDERRLLEVAGQVDDADVTFLGAHVVPPEHTDDPDRYVDLVRGPMLRRCAPLARWCDVFCEAGAFDADQSRVVLEAGRAHGLGLRVHANQLGPGPGIRLGVEMGAAAVDHCTFVDDADVDALAASSTVATLLPAVEFSTRTPPAPARTLLDAGVQVALASDCNPGSSYTTSMAFVVALACHRYGLTPDEAVRAATLGGARALARDEVGHLGIGAVADLVVLDAPDPAYLAYRPGLPQVHAVIRRARIVRFRGGVIW